MLCMDVSYRWNNVHILKIHCSVSMMCTRGCYFLAILLCYVRRYARYSNIIAYNSNNILTRRDNKSTYTSLLYSDKDTQSSRDLFAVQKNCSKDFSLQDQRISLRSLTCMLLPMMVSAPRLKQSLPVIVSSIETSPTYQSKNYASIFCQPLMCTCDIS